MNEQEYLDMTISLYDQEADTFAVMVRDYSPYIKYYDMFLPHLSGKKILDIGSGSGRDMLYFYNHGYDVTGVELSK
ncbi:MAG: hypothetical protein H6766_00950 [Candidatus Peribacteria bacterium]|nr:MAG: hypothetical protein H6766_00950 [Candidatus Peribacteria bacterium]